MKPELHRIQVEIRTIEIRMEQLSKLIGNISNDDIILVEENDEGLAKLSVLNNLDFIFELLVIRLDELKRFESDWSE